MTQTSVDSPTLVFQVKGIALYQCDLTELFWLYLDQERLSFRSCELIAFRRRVQQIDWESLVASHTPDLDIVHLPHCNRLFVFTTAQLLQLRELLAGSFVMLELNSIIHRTIVRKKL